jgi:hypothetical protein
MDLSKQGLVGPLNVDRQHQISQNVWTAFSQQAEEQVINTYPLDNAVPLK